MASESWMKAAREGRYAAALEALESARVAAGRDASQEAASLAGLADVHVSLGQVEAARAFAQEALKIALRDDLRAELAAAYVALARIEAALEQWGDADLYVAKADHLLAQLPPSPVRGEAALAAAEVALGMRRPEEAMDRLRRAQEDGGIDAAGLRPSMLLWQGRVLSDGPRPLQALSALERAYHAAEESSDLEALWQVHLALGRLHQRVGDLHRGEQHLRLAADLVTRISSQLAPAYRAAYLSTSPRKELLAELGAPAVAGGEARAGVPGPEGAPGPGLRRVVEVIRKINSEMDLGALLRLIVDTMVDLSRARAGYLLLLEKGRVALEVARHKDRRELSEAEAKFSRTIAERVARTGRPVVTGNAPQDPEVGEADSIRELSLRSILCIPLRIKARTVGVIYLDNAEQTEAFTADDQEVAGILADQAAIAIENASLHERSTRDALTGAHSHSHFEQRLEEEVRRAQRHGRTCSLLLIDLDDFRAAQEALGHAAADAVLREVFEVVRDVVARDAVVRDAPAGAVVGRYSGDEFEVLLAETGRDGMRALATRILEAVRARKLAGGLTVSIGGAVHPDDAADARSLFLKAEDALFLTKRAGKDRFWTHEADGAPPPGGGEANG